MSSTARRFVDAFLRGDSPSAAALLATEATFHSPVRDYAGAERIATVWEAVAGIIVDARTTSVHDQERETIAFFVGAIRDLPVDGVLRTLTDDDDRVSDVTLMVRPGPHSRPASRTSRSERQQTPWHGGPMRGPPRRICSDPSGRTTRR